MIPLSFCSVVSGELLIWWRIGGRLPVAGAEEDCGVGGAATGEVSRCMN